MPVAGGKANARTDERIERVADALARLKAVSGILCFGSRALGREDERSDADLYVLTARNLPRKAARKRVFGAIPGLSGLRQDCPGNDRQWWPLEDKFTLCGLEFEVVYSGIGRIRRIVKQVRQGRLSVPELRFRAHTLPGLLANATVLHDADGSVAALLRSLYPYPPRLRHALIRDSLASLERLLGELRDAAQRRIGATAFLFHLVFMNAHLSTLLHAINRKYDPATKRVEQDLANLAALPPNFLARYQRLLAGPFDTRGQLRAAREYSRFIEEARALT